MKKTILKVMSVIMCVCLIGGCAQKKAPVIKDDEIPDNGGLVINLEDTKTEDSTEDEIVHTWEDNVMMSDPHRDDLNTMGDPVIGSSTISREDITAIEVLGTLENAPSSAWDVSEKGDNSVMAWVKNETLYIAGEGGVCAPKDCSRLFENYTFLTEVNFNGNFHTEKVTSMNLMFASSGLESLNTGSNFDTSNVKNMGSMFYYCFNLTHLNLGNDFDTSSVEDMSAMFYNCQCLESVSPNVFDASGLTKADYMLYNCPLQNGGLKFNNLSSSISVQVLSGVREPEDDEDSADDAGNGDNNAGNEESGISGDDAEEENTPENSTPAVSTPERTKCSLCHGMGICTNCDTGACRKCMGVGRTRCTYCAGTKKCHSCWGDGYQYRTVGGLRKVKCTGCGGSGLCRYCSGTGGPICTDCHGSGKCSRCGGSQICIGCGGSGYSN